MSLLHPIKLLFMNLEDYKTFTNGQYLSVIVLVLLYTFIALILTVVYLANNLPLIISIPLYAICIALIGWAQYSIGNGMHEAVHKNLLNTKRDFWVSVLVANPIGLTMSYRYSHLKHHRFFGTNEDPDWGEYNKFPASRFALFKRFMWFVSGVPAVLQFLKMQIGNSSATSKNNYQIFVFLLVQASILTLFILTYGNIIFYLVFWILPIATVGKLLSSSRLLCEHGSPDRNWVVRSIDGPRWQTWILGAFDFNYHAEHHLIMSVPYANLKRLHERNRDYANTHPEYNPFLGRMEFFSGGYIKLITKWFKELPWI